MAQRLLNAMARRWERMARTDAMHFIATRPHQWTSEEFFASAGPLVDYFVQWIGLGAPRERALDIGCGMGRVTAELARRFQHVVGVDISPEMIRLARESAASPNASFAVVEGDNLAPLEDASFDFIYCGLVMQHIPSTEVIQRYLLEIARVLKPGAGRAAVQFDTRRASLLLQAYKALPDAVLPRHHRRFIRRYRRRSDDVRQWVRGAGLAIIDEADADSPHHFLLLACAEDGPPARHNARSAAR